MAEVSGGVDIFMLLETKAGVVKGESKDHSHTNEIQVMSVSYGASNPTKSTAGDGDWKPDIHDVVVASRSDAVCLPVLYQASISGTPFTKVTLSWRKAGAKNNSGEANGDYMQVRLINALISSYSVNSETGGATPTESISFTYQQVEFMYLQQNQQGVMADKVHKGWHVGKNKCGVVGADAARTKAGTGAPRRINNPAPAGIRKLQVAREDRRDMNDRKGTAPTGQVGGSLRAAAAAAGSARPSRATRSCGCFCSNFWRRWGTGSGRSTN